MKNKKVEVILQGDDAINLYLQGEDEWNQWVERNPDACVDFEGIDFAKLRTEDRQDIDFSYFNFPKGDVTFRGANFGQGDVSFFKTTFSIGEVNFTSAKFGEGVTDFNNANFGDGNVSFASVNFGDGDVSFASANFGKWGVNFSGATFGEGDVDFSDAIFGEGMVGFVSTNFGDGDVNFYCATFGKGFVNFNAASFGKGNVNFFDALFGKGRITFNMVNFGEGLVNFDDVNFGEGDVDFSDTNFGEGVVGFESITVKGKFSLLVLKNTDKIKKISFKYSSFERTFDISNNVFNCVVDLTQTNMKNHVSLEGLVCKPKNEPKYLLFKQIADKEDIARLRRLKELAENNKDHERAQGFHAKEMRAKRWHETKLLRGLEIDYLFDWLSNYGKSIIIPSVWLMLSWLSFGYYYFTKAPQSLSEKISFLDALRFSVANILPFLPSSKGAREKGITLLFESQDKMPYEIYTVMFFQGSISFILLFLIGLALRNRFRI